MIRRLSLIALLAAALSPLALAVTKNKTFPEYTFNKGVDTYHTPTSIPEGYAQNSLNVLFDDVAPVTKRAGYAVAWSTKTYSYQGLWTYTDGTNTTWQLSRSSDQITASNLSGLIVKVATVSVNNLVGETNAFGNAYFVDQSNGVYFWNGSTTTYVSGSPLGSIITSFHGRLWVTGVAVPYGNQLYGSAYFNGQNWTTGLNDTDPVQYSIGLQDNFDNTTAEYVYLDTLYLFKHASIYALYGFGQPTFQISQLTQECGCIDGATIQTYNSALEFVSLRGVEAFNGYSCKRISDSIKNKIDPAIQAGSFSQQSWVQSTTQDWQAGSFNASSSLSAVVASPALVLSTSSFSETTSAQFGAGAPGVGIDTASVSNVVTLKTYISDQFSNLNNWSQTLGTWSSNTGFLSGTSTNGFPERIKVSPQPNPSADLILQFNYRENCSSPCAQTDTAVLNSSHQGYGVNIVSHSGPTYYRFSIGRYDNFGADTDNFGTTAVQIGSIFDPGWSSSYHTVQLTRVSSSGLLTLYVDGTQVASGTDTNYSNFTDIKILIDAEAFGLGRVNWASFYDTARTGNFTSQSENSGLINPVWGVWSSTTNYLGTYAYSARSSGNSSSGYSSDLVVSNGVPLGVPNSQYLVYSTTLSATSPTALPQISGAGAIAESSSGTFKSQIHNSGAMTSWGNFSVTEALNGGGIAFSVCSSTNSNMSFPRSCANQTLNSQIIAATGTFVQWYATFTVTAATQTPTLQSATVQWFSGTKAIPMASTVWDNRYWLALTTNTADTGNDAVMVLNQTGAWAPFDIHAGAFTQYKNSLYHADSLGSGNIYLDGQAWADNGSAINAFVNTRNESLGDLSSDDYMYALYPTAAATGNCAMTVQYSVDSSTTTYSLGSPLLSEFALITSVRLPFPIDSSHQVFGQSVDFTLGTNDGQCAWQLLGIEGLFKSRPIK